MIVHVHATDILSLLCKWKRQKWLFFVAKRYAVRETEKWMYAVRNAKIGRYAVRKGGGGVTLIIRYILCIQINTATHILNNIN